MLLERFGLWEARSERVGVLARHEPAPALCRALLHDPELLVLDEPYASLDEQGGALLDRELEELVGSRTLVVSTHDPHASRATGDPAVGALVTYLSDVVALTRDDLRVELRAQDTLPAMLLFVLSTLVVFHFALPEGTGDDAAYGLLWVAIVFTALLGLARAWYRSKSTACSTAYCLPPATAAPSGSGRRWRHSRSCSPPRSSRCRRSRSSSRRSTR